MKPVTSLLIGTSVLLAVAARPAPAAADVVVFESYGGPRPSDAAEQLAPLYEELRDLDYAADPTALAMFRHRPATATAQPRYRDTVFKAFVGLSLARVRLAEADAATAAMAELVRSFPDREISRAEYGCCPRSPAASSMPATLRHDPGSDAGEIAAWQLTTMPESPFIRSSYIQHPAPGRACGRKHRLGDLASSKFRSEAVATAANIRAELGIARPASLATMVPPAGSSSPAGFLGAFADGASLTPLTKTFESHRLVPLPSPVVLSFTVVRRKFATSSSWGR